jgi:hypothetical protein
MWLLVITLVNCWVRSSVLESPRMDSIRKCAKCGIDLIDTTGSKCPMCGSAIVAVPGAKIWIGALVQFGLSTVFMLIFGFPKFMIGIFGGMIWIGTALSA